MTRRHATAFCGLLIILAAGMALPPDRIAMAAPDQATEPVLREIFNGRDFTGWKLPAEPYWRVVDGTIVGESDADKKGSMLYTDKSYGDVVFETEFRFQGEIDSGVMLRQPEAQVQIGISRSLKRDMTGSFYVGKYPEEAQAKRAGELLKPGAWNTLRIAVRGDTFTVWLNGEQVSTYTSTAHRGPGPIGLQIHKNVQMKVEFRNLKAGEP
jgi:hypothetical protein